VFALLSFTPISRSSTIDQNQDLLFKTAYCDDLAQGYYNYLT